MRVANWQSSGCLLQKDDDPLVLCPDVDAVGFKVVEIGVGGVVFGGCPPVVFVEYVAAVIDLATVAVVDGEFVVFEAVVFYEAADDKAVVDAVAVGCDDVGEGERGVAMVAVPEDVEVVVYGAVAARLVGEVEKAVGDRIGEKAVEEWSGEVCVDYGVVYRSVGGSEEVKAHHNGAVLTV